MENANRKNDPLSTLQDSWSSSRAGKNYRGLFNVTRCLVELGVWMFMLRCQLLALHVRECSGDASGDWPQQSPLVAGGAFALACTWQACAIPNMYVCTFRMANFHTCANWWQNSLSTPVGKFRHIRMTQASGMSLMLDWCTPEKNQSHPKNWIKKTLH